METESAETGIDRRIAENLRAARLHVGLTQKQLAERMRDGGWPGFEQQTITRYEAGQRKVTAGEADALANILGTDIITLLRPAGIGLQSWRIRGLLRTLSETREQAAALRLRQSNLRADLERLVKTARDDGTADQLTQEIAAAEHMLAAGQEK
jgi:transcriptional regulator with XRE-family HTH domain